MRRKLGLFAIVLVAIVIARPVRPLAQSQGTLELRAAMETETIKGDLSSAIKQYSAVVAKFKSDRAVTAVALVRMAECYQKMGDAQARKIYEQVVKDYADQTDAVAEARMHLGGSDTRSGRQTNTLVWSGDDEGTISPDG